MKNFDHDKNSIPPSGTYSGVVYDETTIVLWGKGRDATRYRINAQTPFPRDTPISVIFDRKPSGYNARITPVDFTLDERLN